LLKSEDILNSTFEYACSTSIKENESKETLLKKFNGDKIALMKFLRDRSYDEWIKTNKKPADTSDIQKGIQKVIDKRKEEKEKERELEEKFNKDKDKNNDAPAVEEKKPIGLAGIVEKATSPRPPAPKQKQQAAEKKRTWTKAPKKSPPPDNSGQASLF